MITVRSKLPSATSPEIPHPSTCQVAISYETVTITVNKQSKDTSLGLNIGNNSLKVISVIGSDSLFFDKDLKEGDVILAINGTEVSTITEVVQLTKDAVGKLTLVVRREEKTQVGSSEIPRAPMR